MLELIPITSTKERVRAARLVPKKSISVASKTIGTELTYHLNTQNISGSGMLLVWNQMRPIPFIENTILELTIDPGSSVLKKPVHCLGKVVRKQGVHANGLGGDIRFGISIVQIDTSDLDAWEHCLDELVASGADVLTPPEHVRAMERIAQRAA